MRQYDKIMREMTPRKYATLLYEHYFRCFYCAYYGTKKCSLGKINVCYDGIEEELEKEVDLDEVEVNEANS